MNYFSLMTRDQQDERIRQLKRSGLRDEMISSLTGRSVTDVRRILSKTPSSAVVVAAVFSSDTVAFAAINTPKVTT